MRIIGFVVCIATVSTLGFCQQETTTSDRNFENDISVNTLMVLGSDYPSLYRYNLQYRRLVEPGLYKKIGLSYTRRRGEHVNTEEHRLGISFHEVTDSTRIRESYFHEVEAHHLRLGADKDFLDGIFSIGGSFIVGYSYFIRTLTRAPQLYNPVYDEWSPNDTAVTIIVKTNPDVDPSYGEIATSFYLDFGVSANINLNAKISERWGLVFSYEPILMIHPFIKERIREYASNANLRSSPPESLYSEFASNFMGLVRFRF